MLAPVSTRKAASESSSEPSTTRRVARQVDDDADDVGAAAPLEVDLHRRGRRHVLADVGRVVEAVPQEEGGAEVVDGQRVELQQVAAHDAGERHVAAGVGAERGVGDRGDPGEGDVEGLQVAGAGRAVVRIVAEGDRVEQRHRRSSVDDELEPGLVGRRHVDDGDQPPEVRRGSLAEVAGGRGRRRPVVTGRSDEQERQDEQQVGAAHRAIIAGRPARVPPPRASSAVPRNRSPSRRV